MFSVAPQGKEDRSDRVSKAGRAVPLGGGPVKAPVIPRLVRTYGIVSINPIHPLWGLP